MLVWEYQRLNYFEVLAYEYLCFSGKMFYNLQPNTEHDVWTRHLRLKGLRVIVKAIDSMVVAY